jgi:hypothetical protein
MVIVFLMCKPDHVEITAHKPRNPVGGRNFFEILQEIRPKLWRRGSVNICNAGREIGGGFREEDRKSEGGGVVVGAREQGVVPRCQEATRGPCGRNKAIVIQSPGEEGGELGGGEFI